MEANSTVSENGDSLSGYTNGSVEAALTPADTSSNSFFEATDHVGAVASAESDWTSGWAYFPESE